MSPAYFWYSSDSSLAAAPGAVWQAVRALDRRPGAAPGRRRVLFRRPAARSLPFAWERAVAALVVLTALLAGARPAAAQDETEYAGNWEQDSGPQLLTGAGVFTNIAQRFTTGSDPGGYQIVRVTVETNDTLIGGFLPDGSISPFGVNYVVGDIICSGHEESLLECPTYTRPFSASVCRVLANGNPDTSACTPLDRPGSFPTGVTSFTVDNESLDAEKLFLAPNTTYTLLLGHTLTRPVVY